MEKSKKTLVAEIIIRAIGQKGFDSLYEQYKNARFNSGPNRDIQPPTSSQLRLASLVKKEGSYKVAAQKAGVDTKVVYQAVNRVSRWNYLKGDL